MEKRLAITEQKRLIAAVIFIQTVASLSLWLVPMLVGAVTDHLGFGISQAGFMATADVTGVLLATISALFWIQRVRWRILFLPLLVSLLALNLASMMAVNFLGLYALRLLAGFIGGCLMSICSSIIGASSQPERNIALFTGVQMTVAAISFLFLPGLIEGHGVQPIYLLLASLSLAGLFARKYIKLGQSAAIVANEAPNRQEFSVQKAGLLLQVVIPVFLFNAGASALWAFIERLGVNAGISTEFIGWSLAAAMYTGMLGSGLAFWAGMKFGRWIPFTIVFGLQLLSIYLLRHNAHQFAAFVAACAFLGFGFNAVVGYQFGLATQVDNSGRAPVAFLSMIQIGMISGPMMATTWIVGRDYAAILPLVATLFSLSWLFTSLLIFSRHKDPAF